MPEPENARHFTPEEVNALLPRLVPMLLKLQDALREFEAQRADAVKALQLARTNGKTIHDEDSDTLAALRDQAAEIEASGCVIKDYGAGLLDFPSWRDGREVYLCWKLGEPEVVAWHELDEGFASRKAL